MSTRTRVIALTFAAIVGAVYVINPFGAPTWSIVGRLFGQQIFRMPNAAMAPFLADGGTLRVCYSRSSLPLAIGDVVAFRTPDHGLLQIKRVAALGGSVIEIRDSVVMVDGHAIVDWFHADIVYDYTRIMGALAVPDGMVFLLGDNLARSRDSRIYGPVPDESIVGRLCGV